MTKPTVELDDSLLFADEVDSVLAQCLAYEAHWFEPMPEEVLEQTMAQWLMQGHILMADHALRKDKLDVILDCFYGEWGFSGHLQPIPESLLNSVGYALTYRTGDGVSLGLVLMELLTEFGFKAEMLVYHDELFVEVIFNTQESYLVEPITGQLSWVLRPENTGEGKQDEDDFEYLSQNDIFKLFLTKQKWAFIQEQQFAQAFACVSLLMELLPNDPYEHRDRGFLLQRLDCEELARKDFEFFIEKCPKDPTVEFLKQELAELTNAMPVVH